MLSTSGCKKQNIESEYVGETGKNAYTKSKQHMGGLKRKIEDSAFYKHWRNCHETPGNEDPVQLKNYEFKVDNSFQDPISRQRNEMFRILNSGHPTKFKF